MKIDTHGDQRIITDIGPHWKDDPVKPHEGRQFIRSSYCAACECVEVAIDPGNEAVAIRDSSNLHAVPLEFNRDEWSAFVTKAKAGEFDR
jgi:hypothetical protein